MNQRIKELTKQADGVVINKMMTGATQYVFLEKDLERFAQLIVRECVRKIETYRIPVGNSTAGEMACEWTYDALKEIRDEIREHFGVEEK